MRTLVIGDVHGGYRALVQVLERASFDREKDRLVFLGDLVDGWPETKEVFEYVIPLLEESSHHIVLLGNHDEWYLDWLYTGYGDPIWYQQGGQATWISMAKVGDREAQREFLSTYINRVQDVRIERVYEIEAVGQIPDRLFVHGGYDVGMSIYDAPRSDLIWDRTLFFAALARQQAADQAGKKPENMTPFDEVFIGHTTTSRFSLVPYKACEVWMLDQGGGWEGKLSVMDVDTKEYWQSDIVADLYPNCKGRR